MAGSERSREAKLISGALIVGLIGGAAVSRMGNEGFPDKAHTEVDKYVTGQPFERDDFELDVLKGPVPKAALEAAVRGSLRQYGEDDAYKPSPEARAVVWCAGAAANELALDDETKNNFIAGGRFEGQNEDDAADEAYAAAASGCQAALEGALAGGGDIVIPVDENS